jgi:hypothetical protein
MSEPKERLAHVTGGLNVSLELVERYLPSNYTAYEFDGPDGTEIRVRGHDNAGWTLDGYVIPRLASGLIAAQEVQA